MNEINAGIKVQAALDEYEMANGVRPNRIIIGHRLLDEVLDVYYYKDFEIKTLEEVAKKQNLVVYGTYEGIPFKIDYDNPYTLEVKYVDENNKTLEVKYVVENNKEVNL